MTECDYNTMNT